MGNGDEVSQIQYFVPARTKLTKFSTRSDPYQNVPPFQVILHVATKGLRPQLAPELPAEWSALIEQCWNDDPEKRPTFAEIQEILEKMNLPK